MIYQHNEKIETPQNAEVSVATQHANNNQQEVAQPMSKRAHFSTQIRAYFYKKCGKGKNGKGNRGGQNPAESRLFNNAINSNNNQQDVAKPIIKRAAQRKDKQDGQEKVAQNNSSTAQAPGTAMPAGVSGVATTCSEYQSSTDRQGESGTPETTPDTPQMIHGEMPNELTELRNKEQKKIIEEQKQIIRSKDLALSAMQRRFDNMQRMNERDREELNKIFTKHLIN